MANDLRSMARAAIQGNPVDPLKKPGAAAVVEVFAAAQDDIGSLSTRVTATEGALADIPDIQADTAEALANSQTAIDTVNAGIKADKATVRVLATANVAVATALENGDTLDGVTLATGNRVALTGQTTSAENGVYVVIASGAAPRAADMDSSDEILRSRFTVAEGTHAGEAWSVQNTSAITVGTTAIVVQMTKASDPTSAEVIAARGADDSLGQRLDASERAARRTEYLDPNSLRLYERRGLNLAYLVSEGRKGWMVGINITRAANNLVVTQFIGTVATTTKIRLRVYRRPLSVGNSSTRPDFVAFGSDAADVLLANNLYALADVGLTNDGMFHSADFDLSGIGYIYPDDIIGLVWTAENDAAATQYLAVRRADYPDSTRPGWSRGGSINTSGGLVTYPATQGIGVIYTYDTVRAQDTIAERVLGSSTAVISKVGYSLVIPALLVRRPDGDLRTEARSTAFSPPASEAIANETTTGGYLATKYQYFSALTAVNASTSAPLTYGVHYFTYPQQGIFALLAGGAGITAKIGYTGHKHRYDLVVADAVTGAVSVIVGTDRIVDPESYVPTAYPGKIPLYLAYVWRDGVDLIPVHNFNRSGVRHDRVQDWQANAEHNRRCLKNTIARAHRGDAITFAGYGDSIISIGGGSDLTPGGANRDLYTFFSRRDSGDVMTGVPRYNLDGSANAAGDYVHEGYCWPLRDALAGPGGSAVTYLNYGIGGSDSSNTNTPVPNGLYPARLSQVLASGAHLVILHFGMNELGSTATEANIRNLVGQFKDAGMDVLILTPPRRNQFADPDGLGTWFVTHNALVRAALAMDVAYVSLHEFAGPGNEGAMGMSPKNMCNESSTNHPFIYEFRQYARFIVQTALGF